MKRLLAILSLLAVLGCWGCAAIAPPDPVSAPDHRRRARELISIKDYPEAAEELRLALRKEPLVADYLLRADLLEFSGDYRKARSDYRAALGLSPDAAQLQQLHYRLALLEAVQFDSLRQARELAGLLSPTSSEHFDLQAVFANLAGDHRQALEHCERAIALAADNEAKAWPLYHAALAYFGLRDERNTFGSLFNAINHGRGYGLVARITEFWEEHRNRPFPTE